MGLVTSALSFLALMSCSAEFSVSRLGKIVRPPGSHWLYFYLFLLSNLFSRMLLYGLTCYMVTNFYSDLGTITGITI